MVDIGFVVFAGIIAGLLIMIAVHWFLVKDEKRRLLQTPRVNPWEEEHRRRLKQKKIQEYSKTLTKNPIKPFRPKPFRASKQKFEDLPTIQCKTCGQLFRCDWNDPQLITHEKQELTINKDWKGFEKVGETC